MSKDILIIVEGLADMVFLGQYILALYPQCELKRQSTEWDKEAFVVNVTDTQCSVSIHPVNGKDCLEEVLEVMKQKIDNIDRLLIIFDADKDLEQAQQSIRNALKDYQEYIEVDLFLLPNNRDQGCLEDLLLNIVRSSNKPILDCWDDYMKALRKEEKGILEELKDCDVKRLNLPSNKAKVYTYLSLLSKTEEKCKEKSRDYHNKAHWDLKHLYLEPLRAFLQRYIEVGGF